jgi:hypothetical protein
MTAALLLWSLTGRKTYENVCFQSDSGLAIDRSVLTVGFFGERVGAENRFFFCFFPFASSPCLGVSSTSPSSGSVT